MRKLPNFRQLELYKAFAILDLLFNPRPQTNSLFSDLMLARDRNETVNAYREVCVLLPGLVLSEIQIWTLENSGSRFFGHCSLRQLKAGMAKKT